MTLTAGDRKIERGGGPGFPYARVMGANRIPRTWESREVPLLEAVARAEGEDTGSRPLNSLDPGLREASGLDERSFKGRMHVIVDPPRSS